MVTSLDIVKTGSLELIIDSVMDQIPSMTRYTRNPNTKKFYLLKNEEDFVLGWVLEMIVAHCDIALRSLSGWRNLEPNEYQELINMVINKLPQINSAFSAII
jgi:hypothetical protein